MRNAGVRQPAGVSSAVSRPRSGSAASRPAEKDDRLRHQRRFHHGSVVTAPRRPCPGLASATTARGGSFTSFALLSDTSAWDARPYSFTDTNAAKPDYLDVQFNGQFGGPIKIPGLRNRPNIYVAGQRSRTNGTTAESTLVPTSLERAGDFSRSRDPRGNPVQLLDPQTGQPFAGNVIPADRISPQAAASWPLPETQHRRRRVQLPAAVLTRNRQTACSRVSQTLRRGSRRRPR
jgi:hypothetical protein